MFANKDIVSKIADYLSDREILRLLRVAKNFHLLLDENYFKYLMYRRYPLLVAFRKHEFFKKYFSKCTFAIHTLSEEGIPYFPCPTYNPQDFLKKTLKWDTIFEHVCRLADSEQRKELIALFSSKVRIKNYGVKGAVYSGDLELIKIFTNENPSLMTQTCKDVAKFPLNKLIVDFLMSKWKMCEVFSFAIRKQNYELTDYIVTQREEDIREQINTRNMQFSRNITSRKQIDYLLNLGWNRYYDALLGIVRRNSRPSILDAIDYLVELIRQGEKVEFLFNAALCRAVYLPVMEKLVFLGADPVFVPKVTNEKLKQLKGMKAIQGRNHQLFHGKDRNKRSL